jgi:hypothetical protein
VGDYRCRRLVILGWVVCGLRFYGLRDIVVV